MLIYNQTTNFQQYCYSSQPGEGLLYIQRNPSNVSCDIHKYGLPRNSLLKYSNPLSPSEFPNWRTISLLAVMNRQPCIRVSRNWIDRSLKSTSSTSAKSQMLYRCSNISEKQIVLIFLSSKTVYRVFLLLRMDHLSSFPWLNK